MRPNGSILPVLLGAWACSIRLYHILSILAANLKNQSFKFQKSMSLFKLILRKSTSVLLESQPSSQAARMCKIGQRKYRITAGWKRVSFSNKTKQFSFLVLKTPKAWIFICQAESPFSYTRPIPIVWWMPVLLLEPIASKHNNHMRAIWEKADRPEDDVFEGISPYLFVKIFNLIACRVDMRF